MIRSRLQFIRSPRTACAAVIAIACTTVFLVGGTRASAGSITTTFAGGNGTPDGNMFDVTALNPLQITAVDMHVNFDFAFNLDIYIKPGSYVGFETDPGPWTLVSSGTAIGLGSGTPTPVDVSDFNLPVGSYGMYIDIDSDDGSDGVQYTDGNSTYSNSDVQLDLGAGIWGDFGSIDVFSPRTWNGTIYYNVAPEPGVAGCAIACLAIVGLTGRRAK
ncbi:MAG: hypothetical protein KDA37_05450 [Planctomycetales bacterium]|nr:hypothetical protein [Planctomycetales bacterium]